MKFAMAIGKEMQFALDRFARLRKQCQDNRLQGNVNRELVRERNDALAEAIALIKLQEQHLEGEWKERLHKLHQKLEQWQQQVTK
jgi:hypothetical protein